MGDIIALVISALIGAMMYTLVEFLKKYLREHLSRDLLLKSESGETRRIHIDKNMTTEEIDKLVLKTVLELVAKQEQKTLMTK